MSLLHADVQDVVTAELVNPISSRKALARNQPLTSVYVSLLLFMVVYCARPEDWIPGLAFVPLAKITAGLAFLGLAFSLKQIRSSLPREIIYLGLLVVQLLMAAALSPVWRGGAATITFDFAKVLIIVLVMAVTVSTARRLRRLIFVHAASMTTICAVALLKNHLLLGRLEGMLGGNYADPNDLALAITISLPLAFFLVLCLRSPVSKVAWALALAMMVYTVLATASRGGFVSIVATVAIILWEFAIRGHRRYLLVLAVLGSLILWQFAGDKLVGRLRGTFDVRDDTAAAYGSSQQRQQLFWQSLKVTAQHPLFGVGPGNFQKLSGSWHETHNSFTQMSAEGGVPAFILYALILWTGFKNLSVSKRLAQGQRESSLMTRALLASLGGFVIGSIFLSVGLQFFPYILVAYTTAILSITRKSVIPLSKAKSPADVAPKIKLFIDTSDSEMA